MKPLQEPPNDEQLMLRFGTGDFMAFDELYKKHRDPSFRFILRSVGDRAVAEDLHQDIWTRLINAREKYRPDAKFTTWLYRIAQHRVIDHYRAAKPNVELEQDWSEHQPDGPSQSPEAHTGRSEIQSRLDRAIATLPFEQRNAFLLQAEQGLTLEEIAHVCGVGRETIKSRLRYAGQKLRDALGEIYEPVV